MRAAVFNGADLEFTRVAGGRQQAQPAFAAGRRGPRALVADLPDVAAAGCLLLAVVLGGRRRSALHLGLRHADAHAVALCAQAHTLARHHVFHHLALRGRQLCHLRLHFFQGGFGTAVAGLQREAVEIIGHLPQYLTVSGYSVTPVVALVQPQAEYVLDTFEVADVFEVPLHFLMDPANHQVRVWQSDLGSRRFYSMPYENRFIWGATAGMLRNLYHLLKV